MKLLCTVLGCGGSNGVPQIGCKCYVCTSNNIKNIRTRSAIMIESRDSSTIEDTREHNNEHNSNSEYNSTHNRPYRLVIDTGPDFRTQALRYGIEYLDAVIYTHAHSDHIAGIDDLKKLVNEGQQIPAFMDKITANIMSKKKFEYIFGHIHKLYKPFLKSQIFSDEMFYFKKIAILPFKQVHGNTFSYGFRFGELAYSTDFNQMTASSYAALVGVKFWIVDCLRYHYAPTHSHLEKTLYWINKVKPELAILTHMDHSIDYEEIAKILPRNIIAAYDGMTIEFSSKFSTILNI